jgi:hypothetical protein
LEGKASVDCVAELLRRLEWDLRRAGKDWVRDHAFSLVDIPTT